ncbi:hypothetical protein ACFO4E_05880 [Nocardiopsis mangrovi]|uniref:Uncharacterized protein n=1 Tax=Nocardiopsis mangrovi TaxID=1179818 RepID=A0ABV9DR87_9ACTN
MSRSDSAGRAGRRRSRRGRPDRDRRDDHVRDPGPDDYDAYDDRHGDGYGDLPYEDLPYEELPYEDEAGDGGDPGSDTGAMESADPGPRRGRSGRRRGKAKGKWRSKGTGARGSKAAAGEARAAAEPAGPAGRGRRGVRAAGGIDPVSRFSASALRRVTVLGEGPSQVVYNLAEQSRRKRGTAVLGTLLGLCGTALVALLGVLVYQLVLVPGGTAGSGSTAIIEPPEGHSTLLPDLYQGQEEDAEVFAPIAERPGDAEVMTQEQVFTPAEKLELGDYQLTLKNSDVTDECTSMVWGDELAQALADNGCLSGARGVYQDADQEYVAQFTLFDLSNAEAAGTVAVALDPTDPTVEPGFVLPMDDEIEGLHSGYSQATSQVMGHYLAVYWVARSDGGAPGDDETMATLNVVAMNASVWVYQQVGQARDEQEG